MDKAKRKILLAGIDLDGTLLRDDKTVSEESFSALKSAGDRGIEIVPVTGRPLSGVPDFIKNLDCVRYIVTANGAYITDIENDKTIFSRTINNETAVKYIRLAVELDLYCEAFYDGWGYVDENTMNRHIKSLKGTPLYDYVMLSRRQVDDVAEFFEEKGVGAASIFCIARNREHRDEYKSRIIGDSTVQFCELEDAFIELTDAAVDKGETLKRLCAYLNIPIENTIAFGDGENDLSFLKTAGVSVAMGNAKDVIKEAADIIADTNENNGVAKILKQFE